MFSGAGKPQKQQKSERNWVIFQKINMKKILAKLLRIQQMTGWLVLNICWNLSRQNSHHLSVGTLLYMWSFPFFFLRVVLFHIHQLHKPESKDHHEKLNLNWPYTQNVFNRIVLALLLSSFQQLTGYFPMVHYQEILRSVNFCLIVISRIALHLLSLVLKSWYANLSLNIGFHFRRKIFLIWRY